MAIVYNRIRAGKEDKIKGGLKDAAKGGSGLLGKPLPHGLSSCHMHEDNTIVVPLTHSFRNARAERKSTLVKRR